MAESMLGGTISFLNDLGIYDVILPFLLVFTIVFAILEKTKIFGVEKVDGHTITRKNANAMTAFVMAFFVIGSSKLVSLINVMASQIFLLLFLIVLFLMLVGVLQKDGEYELDKKWRKAMMGAVLLIIIIIFLNALGWLQQIYDFLVDNWSTEAVSAVILLLLIAIFMFWVTKSPSSKTKKDEGD